MYLPKHNEEARIDVLHDLIRTHSLGTWITAGIDELHIDHIPFFLDAKHGPFGALFGHVARANPIWKLGKSDLPSAIIFRGPQAYITPSWYPSKHEHGKAVPTWNYAVVTIHGIPRFIEDTDWLRCHLEKLTNAHETLQPIPWKLDDAPKDYIDKLIRSIVGVEIPITRIVGKWKVTQNRSQDDKLGVIEGLLAKGEDEPAAMASLIRKHL